VTATHRFRFEGSVAVVTGAGSGIGRASALAFARAGSDVVVADIDEEGALAAAAEVEAEGRRSLPVRTDVSRRSELDDLVRRAIAWQRHVDLFFSNAGVASAGAPEGIPIEQWEAVANVNLWPQVWVLRAVLPHMLERGSGYLLHTASAAGLIGNPATAPYVVSKFAVVGLAESLAIYCSGTGIGVSVVCPMVVATNLVKTSPARHDEADDPAATARRIEVAHRRIQETGISAEQVADTIMEGIREGRLYILPHPEIRDIVKTKWDNPDLWVRRMAALWRKHPEALDPSAP
jgi:NAD(P)-dependent dehydrogenase (short-subunit alcohol dehydrogenase family)